MLAALRCHECTAPIRDLAKCAYCGATLTLAPPATGRTEAHYSLTLRVGPSNIDRVAQLLKDHLDLPLDEVRARLAKPPSHFEVGRNELHAHEIASQVRAGGAQAEITSRSVAVPLFTVTLEDAGPTPLKVVVALRSEIEVSVPEAKDIIARVPSVIAMGVEDDFAKKLVAAFEAAGAKTSIR